MNKRIFVLDDDEYRMSFFKEYLKDFDVTYCLNAEEAIKFLEEGKAFDIFFLDHDLGYKIKTGYDFTNYMEKNKIPFNIVFIHTQNSVGAFNMKSSLKYNKVGRIRTIPFHILLSQMNFIIKDYLE